MKLLNEQDAINLAIDAGYPNLHYLDTMQEGFGQIAVLQDPAFWVALGKSRRWLKYTRDDGCSADDPDISEMPNQGWDESWKKHARLWFETLLSEGDMNKFWESLP